MAQLHHVNPLFIPGRCGGVDLSPHPCRALIAARGTLIVCVPGHTVWDGVGSPRVYQPMSLFGFRKRNSAGDVEYLHLPDDLRIRWKGHAGVRNMKTIMEKDARIPTDLIETWFSKPFLTLADAFGIKALSARPFVPIDWKAWK